MKILIIRSSPNEIELGSYNLQEIGLAKALIRLGNKCDIVYYSKNDKSKIQKINFDNNNFSFNIYWLHWTLIKNKCEISSIESILDGYDVFQVGGKNNAVIKKIYKKFPHKTIAYQGPYNSIYAPRNSFNAIKSDLFCSTKYKKNIHVLTKSKMAAKSAFDFGFKNVKTIGVGIDLEKLESYSLKNSDINDNTIKELKGCKILLYVGVIEERRNTIFLLKTFRYLYKKDNSYRLILIGKGKRKYQNKCYNFINKNELNECIIWHKKVEQSHIKIYYNVADVFILPTRYEIFGMVLLEAMYFGVPVFTTVNGGSDVLVKNGVDGYIFRKKNIGTWGNKIDDTIHNKEKLKVMGLEAHKKIVENFTWERLGPVFIENYKKLFD